MKSSEAIEAALSLLAPTGPEYHGGLANHGPMAAEALVALERPDAVVPWVETYRKRLNEHPAGPRPVDAKTWREALGVQGRVGDWIVFFRRELAERPWKAVLAEWTARLSPGVVAAAFHGAIRTAHAVRSLEAQETPARVHELAEGLGYWAATYNALPEATPPARPVPGRRPSDAIAGVPELPAGRRVSNGNITDRLAPLDGFPPFASVADAVDPSGDPSAFLSDLTETFASVYLASVPPGSVITFLHGVTGPAAVRTLLPYVSAEERARLLRYTWQACASFASSNGFRASPRHRRGEAPVARRARRPRDRDRRRARHQVHGRLLPRVRAQSQAGLRPGGDGRCRAAHLDRRQRCAPGLRLGAELLHPGRQKQLVERPPVRVDVRRLVAGDHDRTDLLDARRVRGSDSAQPVRRPVVTSTMSTRVARKADRRRSLSRPPSSPAALRPVPAGDGTRLAGLDGVDGDPAVRAARDDRSAVGRHGLRRRRLTPSGLMARGLPPATSAGRRGGTPRPGSLAEEGSACRRETSPPIRRSGSRDRASGALPAPVGTSMNWRRPASST